MKSRLIHEVLPAVCVLCAVCALFTNGIMAREGALVTSAALWFLRVEMKRARRAKPEVKQTGVLLALGLILWMTGNAAMPSYISSISEAKAAIPGIVAYCIGLLAVPSLLWFYLAYTPVKQTSRPAATLRRPGSNTAVESYKIAV